MARPFAHASPSWVASLAALFLLTACGSTPTTTQVAVTPGLSVPESVAPVPSATAAPTTPAVPASPTTSAAPASPTEAPTAAAAAIEHAGSVLSATHLSDAVSLGKLEGIRFTEAGVVAAAAMLDPDQNNDILWAATYVYASSAKDPGPLTAIAMSPTVSPTVRAMAAAGLIGLGDATGFDVLIATLAGSEPMDGAGTGTIWEFAADVLERYTANGFGPDLSATDAERATAEATWKAWLDAKRGVLRFDPSTPIWVTP